MYIYIYIYIGSRTIISYPTYYRILSYSIAYYPILLNGGKKCPNETPK